jgi:predicted ester cyclase
MADARAIAAQFVDAFNAHDEDRVRALNGETGVMEAPGDVRVEGRDAVTAYAMAWINAFSDATIEVHDEIAEGDWCVQRFTFHGTHDGVLASPVGEIAPTHRRLAGRGVQMVRVEDGVTVETHLYFDQMQVMSQLGLMPEPSAAPA